MTSTIGTLLTASYCMFLSLELLSLGVLRDIVLLLCVLRPIQWTQQFLVRYLRSRLNSAAKRQQLTSLLMRMLVMDSVLYMLCATALQRWHLWWPWFSFAMAMVVLSMGQMWHEYFKEIAPELSSPSLLDDTAV